MHEQCKGGFTYTVETLDKDGNLIDREQRHNVMPKEVLNYVANAAFKQGPQFGRRNDGHAAQHGAGVHWV